MSHLEEVYSYDAPTTFINFSSLNEEEDKLADSWFDHVSDLENVPLLQDTEVVAKRSRTTLSKNNLPRAIVIPMMKLDENAETNKTKMESSSNILCSSEMWQATSQMGLAPGSYATVKQPRRASKRLSGQERNQQLAKIRAERHTVSPGSTELHPPKKKQKVITPSKEKLPESAVEHHADATYQKAEPALPNPKPRLMLTTPMVLKRKNVAVKPKSTEDQELEKMQQLQQEVAEQRRRNESSLKAVIAGAGQPVIKASKQITKTIDFHFRTDDRIKHNGENQPSEQYRERDFTTELRKHPASPVRIPKGGRTKPKPFNLSQGKRKHEEETGYCEFISTAQQVEAFYKRTPPRYHLRSKQKEMEGLPLIKHGKLKLTNPKTPQLQTRCRQRPATCKSIAELEAEELEKLQQYKFRAQKLDPRILEAGPILPKKPTVKSPTKPVGFDLEIERRIQERAAKVVEEEERFVFYSRPCPAKILENVVGVPEKKALPITIPKSPAFTLTNRIRVLPEDEDKAEEVPAIKANPMPHYGVPFKPRAPENRHVELCPFSFDTRDKERQLQKQKMIEAVQIEEVPKFKALPVPDFEHISLPEKKVKMATQLEPFHLQIDERGAVKTQRWKEQIKEELKQQKEAACFKARPNTVTHQEPFVPMKENRILAVLESFELATEKRAKERMEFEKKMAERETQKMMQEEEERIQREEKEKEETARFRHELVHKAQPVRKYKSVEVKGSKLPLTIPKSPNFSDRFLC
ncbi:targeting protein for Xklp2 isoform X2 [Microcaecilia unicolor]|uniref:Targeting protein for Xklp2 isoform X2 n=1 Tax=Microcaecilia unicolor TaxID=1415580 RepID=A0A6P7YMI5_9AMPH|nr:targeting protein for Xklp2 isoform X2 [Microcaecilia unicolor]